MILNENLEAEEAFSRALQGVLERHLPTDHTKAVTIWMEILDLPELAALSDEGTKE